MCLSLEWVVCCLPQCTPCSAPCTCISLSLQVAKRELALECNYTYEGAAQQRFRDLVAADSQLNSVFYVPKVYGDLCSRQVLTTEWVNGVAIDKVGRVVVVVVPAIADWAG